jgi:hypothetical protein
VANLYETQFARSIAWATGKTFKEYKWAQSWH